MANHQHERDLHAGWRQHQNYDHYYHENRGRVSRGQKELAPLTTAKSAKGSVTAPLCYMQDIILSKQQTLHPAWATPAFILYRADRWRLWSCAGHDTKTGGDTR